MDKNGDTMAILKLYELRRDEQMRAARQWYFSEFAPASAMDIIALYAGGGRASVNFSDFVSYLDTAPLVIVKGRIDPKNFPSANSEHIFVYAKIADYLDEVRAMFREPDFFIHLETLCKAMPDFEQKLEGRKRLIAIWTTKPVESV